jgi:hypothetical protein
MATPAAAASSSVSRRTTRAGARSSRSPSRWAPSRAALADAALADATLADAALADATLADATLADAALADATLADATVPREERGRRDDSNVAPLLLVRRVIESAAAGHQIYLGPAIGEIP